MLIINDIHLGGARAGGTTPVSAAALDLYARNEFAALVGQCERDDLMILGDLFDGFIVPNAVVMHAYKVLADALVEGTVNTLVLVRGNHDISKDTTKMSSFDLLAGLLYENYPERVTVISDEPEYVNGDWVLPHAPNQDLFNVWINQVIELPSDNVFVHCNYDNGFAAEADHSLNLSREQVDRLAAAGVKNVVFAHEHQQKQAPNVIVIGNQFPTSISDCLGNDTKRALRCKLGQFTELQTWSAAGSYFEVDWRRIDAVPDNALFVRVKGEASADEAEAVIDTVVALRRAHSAFVITNAVKVDGRELDVTVIDEADAALDGFDVIEFLCQNLKPEQQPVVREIAARRKKEIEDA